jgi:hypothetical protein
VAPSSQEDEHAMVVLPHNEVLRLQASVDHSKRMQILEHRGHFCGIKHTKKRSVNNKTFQKCICYFRNQVLKHDTNRSGELGMAFCL